METCWLAEGENTTYTISLDKVYALTQLKWCQRKGDVSVATSSRYKQVVTVSHLVTPQ